MHVSVFALFSHSHRIFSLSFAEFLDLWKSVQFNFDEERKEKIEEEKTTNARDNTVDP